MQSFFQLISLSFPTVPEYFELFHKFHRNMDTLFLFFQSYFRSAEIWPFSPPCTDFTLLLIISRISLKINTLLIEIYDSDTEYTI